MAQVSSPEMTAATNPTVLHLENPEDQNWSTAQEHLTLNEFVTYLT